MEKVNKLEGDNQYFCCKCNKLVNAETFYKILEPPIKLILNIDYGKNKINNVNQVKFYMEIDIKNYISFYYGQKLNINYALFVHIKENLDGQVILLLFV